MKKYQTPVALYERAELCDLLTASGEEINGFIFEEAPGEGDRVAW